MFLEKNIKNYNYLYQAAKKLHLQSDQPQTCETEHTVLSFHLAGWPVMVASISCL
jgi:hypothetical protein